MNLSTSNWSQLCRNDTIHIVVPGRPALRGTIDMIAADRSVLWIIRDDGGGRTMVCHDDVTVITKVPSTSASTLTP
jgi:hypothetical protein